MDTAAATCRPDHRKAPRRLGRISSIAGRPTMSRWRERLAEIKRRDAVDTPPRPTVQIVQIVQNPGYRLTPPKSYLQIQELDRDEPPIGPIRSKPPPICSKPYFEQARLADLPSACPENFSPQRWETLHQGAVRFMAEWADKALALGWSEKELLAIAEPFARVDLQGAAWFIADATVTAVTADAITLRTVSGSTQRLYRPVG